MMASVVSHCGLRPRPTSFGGPTGCAVSSKGGFARSGLPAVSLAGVVRSRGRVTVRMAARASAAADDRRGNGDAGASEAAGKKVGLPTAASGTVSSASSSISAAASAAADVKVGADATTYTFNDVQTKKGDVEGKETEASNFDGGDGGDGGGDGDGGDGNGGDENGGDGNEGADNGDNVAASMKALASWASTKVRSTRAVDNGLWMAAGSLLGTNLIAWVLLGFMRGGERKGQGGEGIRNKKAAAHAASEEAALEAAAAVAATMVASAAVEDPDTNGTAAPEETAEEEPKDLVLEAVTAVMEAAEANANPLNAPALASVNDADADAEAAVEAVEAAAESVSAAQDMLAFAVIPSDATDPRVVAALREAAEAQIAAAEAMRAAAAAARCAADATAAVQALQAAIAAGTKDDAVTSGMDAATVSMAAHAAAAQAKIAQRASDAASRRTSKQDEAADTEPAEVAHAEPAAEPATELASEAAEGEASAEAAVKVEEEAPKVDMSRFQTAAKAAGRTAIAAASAATVAAKEAYHVASPIAMKKAKEGYEFLNAKYGPAVRTEYGKVKATAESEVDKLWNGKLGGAQGIQERAKAMVAKVQNDFKEMRLKNAAAANDIKKNMAAPTTNSVKP